jgi:carbamate kinase
MQALGQLEKKGEDWYYLASKGWHIKKVGNKKDPTKPWRRVVGSPKPLAIHPADLKEIKDAIAAGKTVIACGGGGVPGYINGEGEFVPIDAVIDKDFASALLAMALKVREMIISTGIKHVAHNLGKPGQIDISYYMAADAVEGIKAGEYKVGQMKEKVEAAANAVRDGVNVVVITEPGSNWLSIVQDPINAAGTLITRGPDPKGRLRGIGKQMGNLVEAVTGHRYFFPDRLQRWQVLDKNKG